jgi:hypothetical protein
MSDTPQLAAGIFITLRQEFAAFGFEVELSEKKKTATTDIVSAFLKNNATVYDLKVVGKKTIKIKFEVDTDPPLQFATEAKLLIQPYSFYVTLEFGAFRRACATKWRFSGRYTDR